MPIEAGLPATCWSVPEVGPAAAPGAPGDPRAAAVAAIATRLEEYTGRTRIASLTCVTPGIGGDKVLWVSDGVGDFDAGQFRYRQLGSDPADPARTCFYEYFVAGQRYWGRGRACQASRPGADRWEGPSTLSTDEPRLFTPVIPKVINGRYEAASNPYQPPVALRRQIVDAMVARFDPAGTEELHGIPTWRYRLILDKDRATKVLPAKVAADLAWGQYASPAYRLVDVWLDASGHARRVVAESTLLGMKLRIGFELWEPANGPAVDVPPNLPGR